jgi:hypothetical protein
LIHFKDYICAQTLAVDIRLMDNIDDHLSGIKYVEIDENIKTYIKISKN